MLHADIQVVSVGLFKCESHVLHADGQVVSTGLFM